jgi:hypothetical protein
LPSDYEYKLFIIFILQPCLFANATSHLQTQIGQYFDKITKGQKEKEK